MQRTLRTIIAVYIVAVDDPPMQVSPPATAAIRLEAPESKYAVTFAISIATANATSVVVRHVRMVSYAIQNGV